MPHDGFVLNQMAGGFAPLATGIEPIRRTGMEGVPLLGGGGGPMSTIAGMAMAPYAQRLMGKVGMMPMGVAHDQNVYDIMRHQQFTQQQIAAMTRAAEADKLNMMRTARGIAALTGTPFGAEEQAAAATFARATTAVAPIMALAMPETLDQLGGMRGSATVMAGRMMEASRYRIDPATGRIGMDDKAVGQMANQLFRELYSPTNLKNMNGVTAGNLGNLYKTLQQRGMIAGAGSEAGYAFDMLDNQGAPVLDSAGRPVRRAFAPGEMRGETMRAVRDLTSRTGEDADRFRRRAVEQKIDLSKGVDSLNGADLDKLMTVPEVADRVRSFDTSRVKKSLQNYTAAVTAMRDIFGDMGRTNAPMSELIQGLEALTMGSTSQIDPGRLGMMVRQTYNLARQSGVSMDGAMMLQQHSGQHAQKMGVENIFAVHATQGALAYGGAYRGQGHAAHTAWGAMNADQLTQLDANLRVQAAGSHMSNQFGALMRLRDSVGGFAEGTDAELLSTAIQQGRNTWTNAKGETKSVRMDPRLLIGVMQGAKGTKGQDLGISEGMVYDMLSQDSTNREYVDKYGIATIARRAQGEEVTEFLGVQADETVHNRVQQAMVDQGMSKEEAAERAKTMIGHGQHVAEALAKLSTAEISNTEQRNAAIGQAVEAQMRAGGLGSVLDTMNEDQRESFLRSTAERFYGHANQAMASYYPEHGNVQNWHRLHNTATLDQADRDAWQAHAASQKQQAMAALGKGSTLTRAIDGLQELQETDPDKALTVIAKAIGGVSQDEISKALVQPMLDLNLAQAEVDKKTAEMAQATDPKDKARLSTEYDAAIKALEQRTDALVAMSEKHGMFTGAGVSGADADRAVASAGLIVRRQADLSAVRSGAGGEISRRELDAVMANSGTFGEVEAKAVLMARRQADPRLIAQAEADIRKENAALSNAEVKERAEDLLKHRAGDFTSVESQGELRQLMAAPHLQSEGEGSALILTRRRMAVGASAAEIAEAAKTHGISTEQATDLTSANLLAKRLGLDPSTYASGSWQDQIKSIHAQAALQEQRQFEVKDNDREDYLNAHATPTGAALDAFRKKHPSQANATMGDFLDTLILGDRKAERDKRFDEYFASEAGQMLKQEVEYDSINAEDMALRLIQSPKMVERMGEEAIGLSKELRSNEQWFREMAHHHAGGDVAKLIAGDLDINTTTKEGQETFNAVIKESQQRAARQKEIQSKIRDSLGKDTSSLGETEKKRLHDLQSAALREYERPTSDLVSSIMSAYGMTPGKEPTETQAEMANLLESVSGRSFGERMLSTHNRLKDAAEKKSSFGAGNAGIDAMVGAYLAVGTDRNKEAEFRKQVNLSDAEYATFKEDVQFQQQYNLLKLGKGGLRKGGEAEMLDQVQAALQDGSMRDGERGGRDEPIHIQGNMTGTLKIEGGVGTLVGAEVTGGSRNFAAPGGR